MANTTHQFLRLKQVVLTTAMSRSWIYAAIRRGQFPSPIRIGSRAVGWISDEVQSVISARISGKTEDEIHELVHALVTARKSLGMEVQP